MPARLVVLLVLLPASCASAPPQRANVLVVAHRGASEQAPENTLAAFRLAWELDADFIEADFHLTADGRVVAHHDKTTERTAGVDRPVAEQTLAELQALDVGRWKDARWAGERIPTLEQVLDTVPDTGGILIEIKTDPGIVPALGPILMGSDLNPDRLAVIAFDPAVIAEVKRVIPATRALLLADFEEVAPGAWRPTARELVDTARQIQADGVDLRADPRVLTASFMRTLRRAGLEVHVWTVNDAALARRMIEIGVDSITTDRPDWLRAELAD